jgi:hypothetical protein
MWVLPQCGSREHIRSLAVNKLKGPAGRTSGLRVGN